MEKKDKIIGFILLAVLLAGGPFVLETSALYFRLVIGLALGYTLSRSYTGFAGSVNRAYNTGSTKLMRTLMFMFVITAIINVAFLLFAKDLTAYDLSINPINLGLLLGGILFGFGMSFSSCCASGVLTDLVTDLPRAGITLIFFCFGVFIGFPIQSTQSWITDSWFTSETGAKFAKGVYFPDWFKWDGLDGYLGATILTVILAAIVIFLSFRYEQSRRKKNTYTGVLSERMQDVQEPMDVENFELASETTYNRVFVKPWTLQQGAFIITIIFALLMGVTKSGWGASTPYGFWFGKVLTIFGVSADSLADFTHKSADVYGGPLLSNGVTVQNFAIFLGTLVFILTSGLFMKTMRAIPKLTVKDASLYALGGLCMGFGTRLSNGCNVGAFYTPIAHFSLWGWVLLITLVAGGILGNKFAKRVNG